MIDGTHPQTHFDFGGRVVVATGGGCGIGLATVQAFLEANARGALVDRDTDLIASATEGLVVAEDRLRGIQMDVAEDASVAAGMETIASSWGGINGTVDNAGICTLSLALDLDIEDWNRVLGVNLRGVWLCARHCRPQMRDGGTFVNIASQAAQCAQKFTAHCSASKTGVIGLTRALTVEFAPEVRVNAIGPGTIASDMIQAGVDWRIMEGHDTEGGAVVDDWLRRIAMGRFQPASAIAKAALFLTSDLSSEITDEKLIVSGGAAMV